MVTIGNAELEVLRVLWAHGPNTVRDIRSILESEGHSWAYTTVQTMLHRLRDKGVVVSEKVGNANRFEAALSLDNVVREQFSDLMDRFGKVGVAPLMLALVENSRFTAEEIETFKALLDRLETTP